MSKPWLRDPAKEQFWRNTLKEYRESGLGQKEFCARRGLNVNSLNGWNRIIKERDSEKLTNARAGRNGRKRGVKKKRRNRMLFAEVAVRDDIVVSDEKHSQANLQDFSKLEVVLPGERLVVRVGQNFDPSTLQRLVQALVEMRC